MTRRILLDTGPLVAFLNRTDRYHEWTVGQFAELSPPLLTCEAVLSEACFLLRHLDGGPAAVLELLHRKLLAIPFRLEQEATSVVRLLARYVDVPISLADACLIRMAEQHQESAVLTVDQDFRLYRKHGRQVIPVLMPR